VTTPPPIVTIRTHPGEPGDAGLVVALLARLLVDHDQRREERKQAEQQQEQAA